MGPDGTLKEFGDRAAGQGCILKITTGNRKPVKETEKATKKRGKTGVYCLVLEIEEGYSE